MRTYLQVLSGSGISSTILKIVRAQRNPAGSREKAATKTDRNATFWGSKIAAPVHENVQYIPRVKVVGETIPQLSAQNRMPLLYVVLHRLPSVCG